MSWLLRLLAIGGLWRKLSGTYHQARSHVRQAGQFAHGVMEKHVQEALEKAELGDREAAFELGERYYDCLLYTSPSPRDKRQSRMPSSA